MKLSKAISKIKDPTVWDVRFYEKTESACGTDIHTTTTNVDTLYFDWQGACENCPENGTYIYGVMFANIVTGHVFLVDNIPEGPEPLSFEDLMHDIESLYTGKERADV